MLESIQVTDTWAPSPPPPRRARGFGPVHRRSFVGGLVGSLLALLGESSPAAVAARASEGECADSSDSGLVGSETYLTLEGRWIQVDLNTHEVTLCSGSESLTRFPAATGRNGRPSETTFPGLFRVYSKATGPSYLPNEGVYVRDWVGFDPTWHNGFHSFPLDARGSILDNRVGRNITAGCVRTAASDVIYQFAELGMPVLVLDGASGSPGALPAPLRTLPRAI
jgi:hypothetical protein